MSSFQGRPSHHRPLSRNRRAASAVPEKRFGSLHRRWWWPRSAPGWIWSRRNCLRSLGQRMTTCHYPRGSEGAESHGIFLWLGNHQDWAWNHQVGDKNSSDSAFHPFSLPFNPAGKMISEFGWKKHIQVLSYAFVNPTILVLGLITPLVATVIRASILILGWFIHLIRHD